MAAIRQCLEMPQFSIVTKIFTTQWLTRGKSVLWLFDILGGIHVIFQKRVRVFHQGFKHEKTDESTRPQAEAECLKLRWNTKHEFLKLLLQQKKISLNYHLNRFSQFNYYIWDVKYAWTSKKCVWCAWSYHLIAALWQFLNIQQLRSCYLAVCQLRANTLLHKANGRVQI